MYEKKYLDLALPSGFECIVGVLITMTDTFMISRFGSEIIASVGAMGTVIDFMYLVLQSINVSNNVIVARLLGRNNKAQAKITVGTALIIAIICSLICIILTLSISKFIPKMFLVNRIGLVYLYIRLIGVIPNTILTILSGYQRTLGNSKRMLNIRMLCFFLNAVLDFTFIKLEFGITGVALSTILVEIINMVVLVYYSKKLVKIKFVKSIAKEEISLIQYNIYERKKIFLDNQSRNGNELVWIMDENSICLSKNGDGGATSISKIELPKNSKAGEVYENINGKYILNFDLTNELKKIE